MRHEVSEAQATALIVAAADLPESPSVLARARALAEPLLASETLDTGENTQIHADGVADILRAMGGSPGLQAAAYLVYACEHLSKPEEVIARGFGADYAALAAATNKLVQVQRQARTAQRSSAAVAPLLGQGKTAQVENVRKMLLAFSRDLRVVLLRLASRLQTLRHYAHAKCVVPADIARESLDVFAPLANRLGIWELKWELEDLAFRFLEPDTYRQVAQWLDQTRSERETQVQNLRTQLESALRPQGLALQVQGRPKHIYSIVKKMRGKELPFEQVYDRLALRIVTPGVTECYAALDWVHSHFAPIHEEFDDYIARPKVNGYQSLHTVVRDVAGHPIEIQIRSQSMHEHAEHGVAAHWAYKEAGSKGYSGVNASSAYDAKIAVLRQLLAWERDLSGGQGAALLQDRLYVLTPQASIVDLPQGATPIDFAYCLHTDLGHRCRGARVDGVMVPLNTPLENGQTVEITAVREGGPSRDWLNPELGFLVSPRARAKVRAWFNALALAETTARGRDAIEKLLQREGRTALKLDDLAEQLGFERADDLFEVVGKDEFSLKTVEAVLHPVASEPDLTPALHKPRGSGGGVLVVGVDSLLTQLARCCRPAPPDAIVGFVTRGKGVSVHRADCANIAEMLTRNAARRIEVQWGAQTADASKPAAVYPVDVAVQAHDRQGLLRDISECFAKHRINVIGVQTQSIKGVAWMTFTAEVHSAQHLEQVLAVLRDLHGVSSARRR